MSKVKAVIEFVKLLGKKTATSGGGKGLSRMMKGGASAIAKKLGPSGPKWLKQAAKLGGEIAIMDIVLDFLDGENNVAAPNKMEASAEIYSKQRKFVKYLTKYSIPPFEDIYKYLESADFGIFLPENNALSFKVRDIKSYALEINNSVDIDSDDDIFISFLMDIDSILDTYIESLDLDDSSTLEEIGCAQMKGQVLASTLNDKRILIRDGVYLPTQLIARLLATYMLRERELMQSVLAYMLKSAKDAQNRGNDLEYIIHSNMISELAL